MSLSKEIDKLLRLTSWVSPLSPKPHLYYKGILFDSQDFMYKPFDKSFQIFSNKLFKHPSYQSYNY